MDIFGWLFFGPAKLLALWPLAGVGIAALMIGGQAILHLRAARKFDIGFFRMAPVFAGLLWLIFNGYEAQMAVIAAKNANALLRIDLMVLTPVLYVLTLAAMMSARTQWQMGDATRKTE
jgi:hypothetical protein